MNPPRRSTPRPSRKSCNSFVTLQQKLGLAMILITHNPALLAGLADRVLVLYAGRVAEIGPAAQVLYSPQHPYTEPHCCDACLRILPKPKAPAKPGCTLFREIHQTCLCMNPAANSNRGARKEWKFANATNPRPLK